MKTREITSLLAPVVARFPEMGEFGNEDALLELVKSELESNGEFRALPPKRLLHIISANTAMAGMQSLVRGLILGSMNWCKVPGAGLPRFLELVEALPESLRALVEVSATLPDAWLADADAVVVFGSDATVEKFRRETRGDQIFAGYSNRWSGAVIFSDQDFSSVAPLVRDIGLYDQMGCLSAQIVFLHESIDAFEYGERLATALEKFVQENATSSLNLENAAHVTRWRSSAEWKAVEDPENRIWLSKTEPVWGVALTSKNDTPGLSCLHRHVSLQVFTDFVSLGDLAPSVSTLGVWPDTGENKKRLIRTGASRICAVGNMQFPHPTWQQDGFPSLGRLVRWVGLK